MDPETRWEIALSIRRCGPTDAHNMNMLAELLACGRTEEGLALAERLARRKRVKTMAKIEDAKQNEERLRKAALRGVKDPSALDQPPQRVKDPDTVGNKGSGLCFFLMK